MGGDAATRILAGKGGAWTTKRASGARTSASVIRPCSSQDHHTYTNDTDKAVLYTDLSENPIINNRGDILTNSG